MSDETKSEPSIWHDVEGPEGGMNVPVGLVALVVDLGDHVYLELSSDNNGSYCWMLSAPDHSRDPDCELGEGFCGHEIDPVSAQAVIVAHLAGALRLVPHSQYMEAEELAQLRRDHEDFMKSVKG